MYTPRTVLAISLLMISSMQNLFATPITINGQNINEILTPGQTLLYENPTATNVTFSFKNGALEIGDTVLEQVESVATYRTELENNKHLLSQHSAGNRLISRSGGAISFNGAYITGGEQVILETGTALELYDAIVQSKEVIFACNSLKVGACFVDAPVLQIESSCPQSLIKIIRFTFNTELSARACIQGIIDFARNETDGAFIVLGAHKAEILLAPQAFE